MKGQSSATIPFIFPFLLLFSSTVYCLTPFCASIDPPIKDIPDLKYIPIPLPKHSQQILNDFLECLAVKFQSTNHPIMEAIYTPQNTSFHQVLLAHTKNRRYTTLDTPKPLAIVAAKHERHVQATVICAKQHGLQIRIRSGGHDYEGLSYVSDVPFVILDMFNLRSIDVNVTEGRVWVQSGATIGELYYEVGKKSRVHGFAAGSCPSVGIGGHFSGGGYGPLLRKYGLTVDNIEDARLVNVNGEILDRMSMGEDLFWAIRGGGGASFGVIISWKIKLLPVPAQVTVFQVERTLEQGAKDVVHRWQYVAPNLPEDLFIRTAIKTKNGSQEGTKAAVAIFSCQFLGRADKLLQLMNESFPELGLQQKDCFEMSWEESMIFLAGCPVGTPLEVLLSRPKLPVIFFKSKSDYVKKPIPKHGWKSLWKNLITIDHLLVQLNPYGGRMSEISESGTPFPHRAGNLFSVQYFISWKEEEIETIKRNIHMSRKLYKSMAPYVSQNPREALQNYRDLDIGANLHNRTNFRTARRYGSKYFKGNFDRLVRVKTMVDPHNFFHHEQSIPPL
ncbi:hypothetical protein C1H46_027785 [Malus baccata]|uniref:FAD-binding PCMH-type domain-containing protein n=1 Tax=Malus baccata TaxID=106549 RepID=A0A540LK07_MALBA|nr:hypothetical protein C1H46_027785 [Malus baccata]